MIHILTTNSWHLTEIKISKRKKLHPERVHVLYIRSKFKKQSSWCVLGRPGGPPKVQVQNIPIFRCMLSLKMITKFTLGEHVLSILWLVMIEISLWSEDLTSLIQLVGLPNGCSSSRILLLLREIQISSKLNSSSAHQHHLTTCPNIFLQQNAGL